MSELNDVVNDFLIESQESLDRLDRDFVGLENDPGATELLGSIFRTIHTIKGTSGFLAFSKLEAVTHAGESLLSRMRDGKLKLTADITSGLLAMVDTVRTILASIESTGQEGNENYDELIGRISLLREPPEVLADSAAVTAAYLATATEGSRENGPDEHLKPLGQQLVEQAGVEPAAIETARRLQQLGDVRLLGEILVDRGVVTAAAVRDVIENQRDARARSVSEASIRVDVALLDKLMDLVGELVLARNQIVQFSKCAQDPAFLNASQRLNLITSELQAVAMKTRMQPIGGLWGRLPRVVRDLALAGGKQVRVETEGETEELDRTLIEAIKDPLTHIVRNSVDHGVETPAARIAAGKDPEGLVFLRSFHEGGLVNIEITDDGAGLDYGKIRSQALQTGLVTAEQAARMSETEVTSLIWVPGFSTAERVSNVSGRGVGLDVVKTNIEKIGGTVDIQSIPGQGCTVRMKIPLTLAIIPALIVTTAGDRYAIPQVSVLELVRLEGDQARRGIELVNSAPVHRLRGRLLPLAYLNRELQVDTEAERECTKVEPLSRNTVELRTVAESTAQETQIVNIVVLQVDERQFGLVVDEINDTEEIMVKPRSKPLKSINTHAGATIMGDGKGALILDVLSLAQRAGVAGELRDRAAAEEGAKPTLYVRR